MAKSPTVNFRVQADDQKYMAALRWFAERDQRPASPTDLIRWAMRHAVWAELRKAQRATTEKAT